MLAKPIMAIVAAVVSLTTAPAIANIGVYDLERPIEGADTLVILETSTRADTHNYRRVVLGKRTGDTVRAIRTFEGSYDPDNGSKFRKATNELVIYEHWHDYGRNSSFVFNPNTSKLRSATSSWSSKASPAVALINPSPGQASMFKFPKGKSLSNGADVLVVVEGKANTATISASPGGAFAGGGSYTGGEIISRDYVVIFGKLTKDGVQPLEQIVTEKGPNGNILPVYDKSTRELWTHERKSPLMTLNLESGELLFKGEHDLIALGKQRPVAQSRGQIDYFMRNGTFEGWVNSAIYERPVLKLTVHSAKGRCKASL